MSTKETLRQLSRLFTSPPSTSTTPSNPFPAFTLPPETNSLLDEHIRAFASLPTSTSGASAPPSGSSSNAPLSEHERERLRWREGLLEIWSAVEPVPGTERDLSNIGRVSAFLVLLDKLSADVGDDDESALVSRRDVGAVWWSAVLKRTMLGTAKDDAAEREREREKQQQQGRGRKPTRKGKEAAPSVATAASPAPLPLFVSRQALAAATRTVVWGMGVGREQGEKPDEYVSSFGLVILNEYEDRALARLKGLDEGYGIKNLEECLISWGEKSPKAFFTRLAPFINPSVPALLPSLSLTLSYLSRHSTKSYHALSTPLLTNLTTVSLTSACAAIVTLAIKCLAIFVVTLPVIIGEERVVGVFAAYGRVVAWEVHTTGGLGEDAGERPGSLPSEGLHTFLQDYDDVPPDPTVLFTVLYGIYPCNFTAFVRDAVGYLREKGWKGPLGDGDLGFTAGAVRARSEPVFRLHTLHPSLFNPTASLSSELTDTKPWSHLEAADVMAACDRSVVQTNADGAHDWRGAERGGSFASSVAAAAVEGEEGAAVVDPNAPKRSLLFEPGSVPPPPEHEHPPSPTTPLDSTAPTPKPASPSPTSRAPSVAPSRAVSRVRSTATSPTNSPASQRVSTPHMPATTHFANFQALQQQQQQTYGPGGAVSPLNMSPLVRPRSASRFRSPIEGPGASEAGGGSALGWSNVLDFASSAGGAHPHPPASNMSRRSSGVASSITGSNANHPAGLLSPELIPFGGWSSSYAGRGPSPSAAPSAAAVSAQLVKLETELVLLQGEVNFQHYLKQLHLQHMGTLHREKVLESGAEAERQSSFRTIRTLRAQLRATQSALDQLRSEQSATKANWIAHIADLREKLAGLREQRVAWEGEGRRLRAEVEDWRERCEKMGRDVADNGRDFLDLKNQVQLDSAKLDKIGEYEHRIQALTKTLAICDADIVKYVEQRKEMNLLVGEWKKSELLRESVEEEVDGLKKTLRSLETELASLRRQSASTPSAAANGLSASSATTKDELSRMRKELERLRARNWELEERLADKVEAEELDGEDSVANV
ncbi:hypothetical protein JCM6882_006467 [Rhodosporidiobolus microsporus]